MLRFVRSRRALTGLALAMLMIASVATPAVAGDDIIVQGGDTLWDIAQRNGTTVAALAALNEIENPSVIHIGQRIVLRPPAAPSAPAPPTPAPPEPIIYVVQPGDTLWAIALRHGTTVPVLAEANELPDPSFIRIGQALAIPQAAAPAPSPPAAGPSTASPTAAAPTPITHTVQAGETLWVISGRYGVSIESIVAANALASASFIRTGQVLVIPTASAVATAGRHRGDLTTRACRRGWPPWSQHAPLLATCCWPPRRSSTFPLGSCWPSRGTSPAGSRASPLPGPLGSCS